MRDTCTCTCTRTHAHTCTRTHTHTHTHMYGVWCPHNFIMRIPHMHHTPHQSPSPMHQAPGCSLLVCHAMPFTRGTDAFAERHTCMRWRWPNLEESTAGCREPM